MEDFRAHRHLQQRGGFGAGLLLDILDDSRPVVMTASANFLGDIPDLDHMADRLWLGDERATTRAADDDTCRLQFAKRPVRSEEHTSELQSLMRISYAVFCLKKKKQTKE